MGLFGDLFGGGAPKSKSTLTQGQEEVSNQIASYLAGGIDPTTGLRTGGGLQAGASGYSNTQIPGFSPGIQNAINQLLGGYAKTGGVLGSGESGALSSLLSGKPAFNLDPSVLEKYFQDAVSTPAMRNFQLKILPQLKEGFASPGNVFSSRQGTAAASALSDMNVGLNAQLAQQAWQAQALQAQLADAAAQRQISGLGYAQQARQAPLQTALGLEQGQFPLQQARMAEFSRMAPENNPYLAKALGYTGQQQQGFYQQPGMLNTLAGGALSTLGLGGALFGGGAIGGGLSGLLGFGGGGGGSGASLYNGFAAGLNPNLLALGGLPFGI